MDLLEETRMKDVFTDVESIISQISKLPVGQPLVWVWVWDIARDIHQDIEQGGEPEYAVTMGLEDMWQLFWEQADQNGFSLEYGTEDLYDALRDWMATEGIIKDLTDEEELDD